VQQPTECPFCNPREDRGQHVVFESTFCRFVQQDRDQEVLVGSGIIVPRSHRTTPFELTSDEWLDTQRLLQMAKTRIDERWHPDGYTLGWNVGAVSNQTVAHVHLHVLPRYADEPYAGRGLRYWLKSLDNRR
jgi:diadenosine tetraphosphate (Ap4A) HIT family hydrolase